MYRTDSVAGGALPVETTGGAIVGRLKEDTDGSLWLVKCNLDRHRHQLHKPPAWATDTDHIRMLRRHGARGMRILTKDGHQYEATLESWERHGRPVGQRGHGDQTYLELRYWAHVAPIVEGQQLQLFGVAS